MKEYAVLLGKDRSLVGILTENGDADVPEQDELTGVLLLNAGLIHHIGPNRIYVRIARLLSSMGFIVLRFDFSGIGDSGPRKDKLPAAESITDEVRQAMDYLEQLKGIKQFVCIGFCSGATAAAQMLAADHRVKRAILIDPPVPGSPETELMAQSVYYNKHALFNPRSWLKFLLMQSSYRAVFKAFWVNIKAKLKINYLRGSELSEITTELKSFFRSLRMREARLFIVYSEDNIGKRYFEEMAMEEMRMMQDSGFLTTERLNKTDHLVTPMSSQETLLNLISKWMR